jgi:hypothetical protein
LLAGKPLMFDKEAVRQSASDWESVLKWQLKKHSDHILQSERKVQPAAQLAALRAPNAAALPVVSITEAMRVTERSGPKANSAFFVPSPKVIHAHLTYGNTGEHTEVNSHKQFPQTWG